MCNQTKTTLLRNKPNVPAFSQRNNENTVADKPKHYALTTKPAERWAQLLHSAQLKKKKKFFFKQIEFADDSIF